MDIETLVKIEIHLESIANDMALANNLRICSMTDEQREKYRQSLIEKLKAMDKS